MKRILFILGAVVIMAFPTLGLADFPVHLGGFVLGDDISNYRDRVNMASCMTLRYMEYMGEGEIGNIPGFKSGLIAFGTCDRPDKIVRIKLKYEDGSKAFFNQLMERFEKSFGPAHGYQGDPFQIVMGWKWSFKDEKGGRISLVLQHNSMNPEEKIGNSVKLTLTSQMDKERKCFEAKQPKTVGQDKKVKGETQWNSFVPY